MTKDVFKKAQMIGFTCWDLNSKWVCPRASTKRNDKKRETRKARRALRKELQKEVM